ncbi:hypothetical protein ESA94_04930 [Lacibacter luteus]|uniref:Lipoprotein n=1 Tax=Lacibacter luteus TaxID=2508719 RepID=A0A4Q1CMQ5_9BACT|nr:hypothetical protein [Lacibacter luteus]RXK62358.1 hypothetical protein ESA94_04930 [Lacibacter luteus]
MKKRGFIFFFLLIGVSCSQKNKNSGIEYIKALTIYRTDSVNAYNKGLGVYWFLSHDFNTDSSISRFPISIEPVLFKTHVGKLNKAYLDTLINTIKYLKKFPEGVIPTFDSTSHYCGPEFHMEFKDAEGTHFYSFIVEGSSPITEFSDFFFRMKDLNWAKKDVNNNIVNSDKETVNAAIKAGFYEEIYPHYVTALCGEGINFSKLHGEWRIAGQGKKDTYYKNVFTKGGEYFYERIERDSLTNKFNATYKVDTQQNLIILNKNGSIKKLRILKLTDECFEFEYVKEKYKIANHRIK